MANDRIDGVDTRVVEMQFDNKQFEKGAGQTLTTLEKLKKSLNFSNAGKGFDSLQKGINGINFSPLQNQIAGIESAFTTLGGRLKMTFFDEISNEIINLGKKLYAATTGQIITGGKSRAMKIAQAKFKMEGMGVDWSQISDDLDYAVAGTAYGLDAAASIASQLVASGVQVGDAMKTALRGVSGVAAMTSSSYEEIGNVFAAVAGQGKAMAMQLNQLSLRGINAASTIAEYLGTTEAEVREMASQGKISFELFSKAMDEAFGEHAKEANKTFDGAFSNIKAALSKIGELFWSPFYESAIKPLNIIRETIVMFKNGLTGALEDIDTKFGLRTTAERLQQIVKVLGDISSLLLTSIQRGLKGMLKYLQPVNRVMITWLHNLKEVRSWLQSIVPASTEKDLKTVQNGIENITAAEIQMAKDIWYKGSYGNGIDRVIALGEHYKVVQAYVDDFINSNYKWADSTERADKANTKVAKSTGKVKEILDSLVLNVKDIVYVIKNFVWPTITKIVTFVKTTLTTALDSFFDLFFKYDTNSNGFISIIEQIGYVIYNVGDAFSLTENDVENLRSTFEGFFKLLSIGVNFISEVFNRIAPLFGEIEYGDSAFLHVTGAIGQFISELYRMLVTEGGISEFFDLMQEWFESLIATIDSLFDISIVEWFDALKYSLKSVADVFENQGVKEGFQYIKDNLTDVIHIDISSIIGVIKGVFTGIKNLLVNTDGFFKEIGDTIVGFMDAIKNVADTIKDVMKKIKMLFKGDFTGLAATLDPSSDEGVVKKINDSIFSIIDNIMSVVNGLIERLGQQDVGAVEKALDTQSKVNNSVLGFIRTSSKDITGADVEVQNIVDTIVRIMNAVTGLIAVVDLYKVGAGIQALGEGIKAGGKAISTAVGKFGDAIKTIAKAEAFKRNSEAIKNLIASVVMMAAAILVFALVLNYCEVDIKYVWAAIAAVLGSMITMIFLVKVASNFTNATAIPALIGFGLAISALLGEFIFLTLLFYKFSDTEEHMSAFLDALRNAIVTITIIVGIFLSMMSAFIALVINMVQTSTALANPDMAKSIEAVGNAISTIVKSIAWLLLGVLAVTLMYDKFDDSDVNKAFLAVIGFVVAISFMLGVLTFEILKVASSYDASALENMAKIIEELGGFIKTIVGSLTVLILVFAIVGAIGMGEEATYACGVILATIAVLAGFFFGLEKIFNGSSVKADTLEQIANIINSMCKFVISVAGSLMALTVISNFFGKKNMWSSLGALLVGCIGLLGAFVALLTGSSQSENRINGTNTINKAKNISDNAIKLVDSLSLFVLAVAAAISIVALVGNLVGNKTLWSALGTMAVVIGLVMSLTAIALKANAAQMKNASTMFITIGVAVLAIAGGLAILSYAISQIDDGEKLTTVTTAIGAVIGILAIMSLIVLALSKVKFKQTKGLMFAMTGIALACLGLAAIIAAAALVAKACAEGPDPNVIKNVFADITGMLVVMAIAVGILVGIGKTDIKAIVAAGGGLALAFLAMGAAMLAIGYILKVVQENDLSVELIDSLKWLMTAVLGLSVVMTSISGLVGPMTLLGLANLGVSLLEILGFLYALTQLEWGKIAQALGILKSYGDTIWDVFKITAAFIGLSVAGGASLINMLSMAAGIAVMAGALMLLAKAIYMLKQAADGVDPWQETVKDTAAEGVSAVGDRWVVSEAIKEGSTVGANFAEGVKRGLWDKNGELTTAGYDAGGALVHGATNVLDIHSPSKVGESIGEYFGDGIIEGLENREDPLVQKASMIGQAMSDSISTELGNTEISNNLTDSITDSIQNNVPDTLDNMTVTDKWGDFAFESYDDYFDDAPVEMSVVPVVDSEDLEAKMEPDQNAMLQDGLVGALSSVDLTGGLGDTMSTALGEGGVFSTISSALSGIFDREGNLKALPSIEEIKSNLPTTEELKTGITETISDISIPDPTKEIGNLTTKFGEWLGEGGVNGSLGKIIALLTGSDDNVIVNAVTGNLFARSVDETAGGNNIGYYSESNHLSWRHGNQGYKEQDQFGNWWEQRYWKDGQLHWFEMNGDGMI